MFELIRQLVNSELVNSELIQTTGANTFLFRNAQTCHGVGVIKFAMNQKHIQGVAWTKIHL